jgi:hypothetical protein
MQKILKFVKEDTEVLNAILFQIRDRMSVHGAIKSKLENRTS